MTQCTRIQQLGKRPLPSFVQALGFSCAGKHTGLPSTACNVIVQYCTSRLLSVQYRTAVLVFHCTALHSTELHSTVLSCTSTYCGGACFTVLCSCSVAALVQYLIGRVCALHALIHLPPRHLEQKHGDPHHLLRPTRRGDRKGGLRLRAADGCHAGTSGNAGSLQSHDSEGG